MNNNLFDLNNLDNNTSYLLGYFINSAYVSKESILKLKISNEHIYILDLLKLSKVIDYTIFDKLNYYQVNIKSENIITNYLELLQINKGKNFNLIKFPNLYKKNTNFFWNFIHGYIDYNGILDKPNNIPQCTILFNSYLLLKDFNNYIKIPHTKLNNKLIFNSTNCIDLLGEIYKNKPTIFNNINYNKFQSYINWKNLIQNNNILDKCKIIKVDENAVIPSKHYESDVGYDLTIIKKVKNLTPSTILYDTGIKLSVDYGYYIEIVPRSSLSKSGYILANSIGIIEKSYSGNLYVALTKIDKEMPDAELPFRCCQLIFKPQISLKIVEENNYLEDTTRNDGGFGSSN
jgi:deoxyuridine 5'-triphosphate nucleotidohydrolase